ncbi:cell division protein ZipA [Vibrio maritimus]|uniref:Cell division protein ZipA n=1 Tax=Vibrio maritimus TaxID=990268 RepID=A0A090RWW9_9VIBR|nr:cell division protein ZipA [Vibrio maritimus]
MQELRFVLIIVGALAIAALLFHGLWSSKKEGQKKFGDRPLGKLDENDNADDDYVAPEDDFEIIRKTRTEPDFGLNEQKPAYDPLDDTLPEETPIQQQAEQPEPELQEAPVSFQSAPVEEPTPTAVVETQEEEPLPSFSANKDDDIDAVEPRIDLDALNDDIGEEIEEPEAPVSISEPVAPAVGQEPVEPKEPEMEVLVLNVHCSGDVPFNGTELFDSMRQNGLIYGEMDIFHRHADLSGTGKVLFSVANMMQPGTLQHDDPATFTTKGISFFMTLPCFGEADQNFKLMLRTAQQISDDLGGNVLDDRRNLITPTRLDAYRQQIKEFNLAKASA